MAEDDNEDNEKVHEDENMDDEHATALPKRYAMSLVDTSSLLAGGALGGQTVPTGPATTGDPTAAPAGLVSDTMSQVTGASSLAQHTDSGAQAGNVDSTGSSASATTP